MYRGIKLFLLSALLLSTSACKMTIRSVSSNLEGVPHISLNHFSATALAGTNLTTPIQASLIDKDGKVATTIPQTVTITAYTDSSCTVPSVTPTSNTQSTTAGVATLTNLKITQAGTYYLKASAPTYKEACSPLTISPAAVSAALSTVTATPLTVFADGTAITTISVHLIDAYSNPIPLTTYTLKVANGLGTNVLATPTTNASGTQTTTHAQTRIDTNVYSVVVGAITITQTASVDFINPPCIISFDVKPSATFNATVTYSGSPTMTWDFGDSTSVMGAASGAHAYSAAVHHGSFTISNGSLISSFSASSSGITNIGFSYGCKNSLQILALQYNDLGTLNLNGMTALTTLNFSQNNTFITAFDFRNTTSLTDINGDNSNNNLGLNGSANFATFGTTNYEFNLDNHPAIHTLNLMGNKLKRIQIKNTPIISINARYNLLEYVDLSNNTALSSINLSSNDGWIDQFDFRNTPALQYFTFENTTGLGGLRGAGNFTKFGTTNYELNFDGWSNLINVNIHGNMLERIQITNSSIQGIAAAYNNLKYVDLSDNASLQNITIRGSGEWTSAFNFDNTPSLNYFTAENSSVGGLRGDQNQSTFGTANRKLDLSGRTNLAYINVYNGDLIELDASNTGLTDVSASGNAFTKINLYNNLLLKNVYINSNRDTIHAFNFELTPSFEIMQFQYSDLMGDLNNATYGTTNYELNLNSRANLSNLNLYNNSLKRLQISNSGVQSIAASGNQFNYIDLSNNASLRSFYCDSNRNYYIDAFNFTGDTALELISFSGGLGLRGNNNSATFGTGDNILNLDGFTHVAQVNVNSNEGLQRIHVRSTALTSISIGTITSLILFDSTDSTMSSATLDAIVTELYNNRAAMAPNFRLYVAGTMVPMSAASVTKTDDAVSNYSWVVLRN